MWKKIASWTGVGLLSLLCLLLISVLLGRADLLGYRTYSVASGSMSPTLDVGDVIYVTDGDPKVGDVVVLSVDGQLLTHRIVGSENGNFVTKGDANQYPDTFENANIVGIVRFHVPLLGRLALSVGAYLSDSLTAHVGIRAGVWDASATTTAIVEEERIAEKDGGTSLVQELPVETSTARTIQEEDAGTEDAGTEDAGTEDAGTLIRGELPVEMATGSSESTTTPTEVSRDPPTTPTGATTPTS